jgi:hypothetical protein
MKNKFLTFFIAIVAVSNIAVAQNKPLTKKQLAQSEEYVALDHIILVFKDKQINMHSINPTNIITLIGKPKQIKKEKSEIDDQIYTTYIYESGQIEFDHKGRVDTWEINKPGWFCIFKVNDKITQKFSLSSNLADVKKTFPHAWAANKRTDILGINIITPDRTPVDDAIVFGIKNSHITFISYFVDES